MDAIPGADGLEDPEDTEALESRLDKLASFQLKMVRHAMKCRHLSTLTKQT